MPLRAALFFLAPLAAADAVAAVPADASLLDTVLASLAQHPHAHARYQEERRVGLLRHTTHAEGELRFDAPDRLEQHQLRPRDQTLLLQHDTLVMRQGTHQRVVALGQIPRLAPVVSALRSTLAGDKSGLLQAFNVHIEGDDVLWHLHLVPRDTPAEKNADPTADSGIGAVDISGDHGQVRSVRLQMKDGDWSSTRIFE